MYHCNDDKVSQIPKESKVTGALYSVRTTTDAILMICSEHMTGMNGILTRLVQTRAV